MYIILLGGLNYWPGMLMPAVQVAENFFEFFF